MGKRTLLYTVPFSILTKHYKPDIGSPHQIRFLVLRILIRSSEIDTKDVQASLTEYIVRLKVLVVLSPIALDLVKK